jgi:hypothetical protein
LHFSLFADDTEVLRTNYENDHFSLYAG